MKKILMLSALALVMAVPVAQAGKHKGGKHHGEKMFEKHDTNSDGVISKDEFMASAEERFAKMDADGNGEITKEEAEAVRKAMKDKWKEHKKNKKHKSGGESAE